MQDSEIVELYWQRNEAAIAHTSDKYNAYCQKIAQNILGSPEDSEECVNDAYLAAWNSIPPMRPNSLATYLGKLTRNISINRYKSLHAARRGGGEFALSLDELDDCVADTLVEQQDAEQLGRLISEFLYTKPAEVRQVFVRRYFYSDSLTDIADAFGMSLPKVKAMLHRTRLSLREHLEKNGINIE